MQLTHALALFSAASALALPTADLNKRECVNQYLPTLWHVNSQTSQPSHPIQDQVLVARQNGPTRGLTDTLVEFKGIPAGSWGCQFELDYQPAWNSANVVVEQGSPAVLNVRQINGEIPANPTWRDVEGITGNLVGTFAVPTGASAQWPQRIVINSFQCQETMRFRLSVNDWSLGYVSFNENTNSGLRISHNC